MRKIIQLTLERETKGAVRYQEVDENGQILGKVDAVVGTLYVRKKAFPDGPPQTLSVTLDDGNN